MYTLFLILHVIVSLFLILVVLLQTGKGASMGAAFGGASSTMFGARGQTTFMHKLTAGMALVFMLLSVTLASLSSQSLSDLEEEDLPPPGQEAGMMGADETEGEEPGEAETGDKEGETAEPAGEEKPAADAASAKKPAEKPAPAK